MSLLEEMFDADPSTQLNERPYSRTQSAIDNAKGTVKGVFGSGQVEQGAAESGQLANSLWSDFKRYIGKKYGKAPQSVPYSDVANFFNANKLNTKFLGANQNRSFSTKDVGTALLKAARDSVDEYKKDEPAQSSQQGSTNQPAQNSNEPAAQQPASSNQPSNDTGLKGQLSSLSASDRAKLLKLIS